MRHNATKIHFCWIIMLILCVHFVSSNKESFPVIKIRRESSAVKRFGVFQNKQNDSCTLIRMSAILPDTYLSPSAVILSTYGLYHVHDSDACILTPSFGWMHPNSVCRTWRGKIMTSTFLTQSRAVWSDSLGGKPRDKESWYTASEGPSGGLQWQIPLCLLIYAPSFGSLSMTFCAGRGWWKCIFRASLTFALRHTVAPLMNI